MRIHSLTVKHLVDYHPDLSYLDQEGFERRKRKYVEGEFSHIGIVAEAQYSDVDGSYAPLKTIASQGCWGIESDSEDSYIKDIEVSEIADLQARLIELGFDRTQLPPNDAYKFELI